MLQPFLWRHTSRPRSLPHLCLPLRLVFVRERAAGLYGCFAYLAAEFLADVPWSLLNSILYSALFYL